MTNLTKTEIKVLKAIAEGAREFDRSLECRAIWKLVSKGYIEAELIEATVQERRAHTFGRHVTYHNMPANFIRVSAPKIEKVISAVGMNTFMRSLAQEEAMTKLQNEWIIYTDACTENCRVPSVTTAKKLVRELKSRGFSTAYYMSLKEKLGY